MTDPEIEQRTESAVNGWLEAQGAISAATSAQLSIALALCDASPEAQACAGWVVVAREGTWTCTNGCDGPPVAHHRPERLELCRQGSTVGHCGCAHCR